MKALRRRAGQLLTTFASTMQTLFDGLVDPTSFITAGAGEWVPEEHHDRLRQYGIFRAMAEERVRGMMPDDKRSRIREYGDLGLVIDTSRNALLGDSQGIEVPGSSDEDNMGARARQMFLDRWARRVRWPSKLFRGETDAHTVGDAVYELRVRGNRLDLACHQPESFFPVWLSNDGGFDEADVAWEEPNNGQYLPVDGARASITDLRQRHGDSVLYRRNYRMGSDGTCLLTSAWYRIKFATQGGAPSFADLQVLGYELDDEGAPLKDAPTGFDTVPIWYVPNIETTAHPWGKPEAHHVYQALVDLMFNHGDLRENTTLNAFPVTFRKAPAGGAPAAPVAMAVRPHLPTEIGASDRETMDYGPGQELPYEIGVADFSNGNKMLLGHDEFLLSRVLANSQTTAVAAGMVQPSEVPSGFALVVALLPLIGKTTPKRETRRDKLGMMLKHVLRWEQANGDPANWFKPSDIGEGKLTAGADGWPAGMWEDDEAYPRFGNVLPVDLQMMTTIIAGLLGAEAISTETGVAMAKEAGVPIDDVAREVARIREASAPAPGMPGSGMGSLGFDIPGSRAAAGPGAADATA